MKGMQILFLNTIIFSDLRSRTKANQCSGGFYVRIRVTYMIVDSSPSGSVPFIFQWKSADISPTAGHLQRSLRDFVVHEDLLVVCP